MNHIQIGPLPIAHRQELMSTSQRDDTFVEFFSSELHIGRTVQRISEDRLNGGERVFDAMIELMHQQTLKRFSLLRVREVSYFRIYGPRTSLFELAEDARTARMKFSRE